MNPWKLRSGSWLHYQLNVCHVILTSKNQAPDTSYGPILICWEVTKKNSSASLRDILGKGLLLVILLGCWWWGILDTPSPKQLRIWFRNLYIYIHPTDGKFGTSSLPSYGKFGSRSKKHVFLHCQQKGYVEKPIMFQTDLKKTLSNQIKSNKWNQRKTITMFQKNTCRELQYLHGYQYRQISVHLIHLMASTSPTVNR